MRSRSRTKRSVPTSRLPTSFALPAEAVDRLRSAAAKIVLESPELRDAMKSEQFHVVEPR